MGRKDKLLLRFLSLPKDFTFNETVRLLNDFGFREVGTGKTGGSRVRFKNEDFPMNIIKFHKPHPESTVKSYVLANIKEILEECNLL